MQGIAWEDNCRWSKCKIPQWNSSRGKHRMRKNRWDLNHHCSVGLIQLMLMLMRNSDVAE